MHTVDSVRQVLVIGLYPGLVIFPFGLEKTHRAAVSNYAQARSEAKEMGEQRRTEIRRRVESMQRDAAPVAEASGGNGSMSSSVEKA